MTLLPTETTDGLGWCRLSRISLFFDHAIFEGKKCRTITNINLLKIFLDLIDVKLLLILYPFLLTRILFWLNTSGPFQDFDVNLLSGCKKCF